MSADARFWRNVAVIAGAHVALLFGFVRWGGDPKKPAAQNITWLSGSNGGATAAGSSPARRHAAVATPTPTADETAADDSDDDSSAIPAAAKSEIQLPAATPKPTATPAPVAIAPPKPATTATAKPKPSATAKPTVIPVPKKAVIAKATPKAAAKPTAVPVQRDDEQADGDSDAEQAAKAIAKVAAAERSARASEIAWYGSMLHDRFHTAWEQPTSVVATGAKMSALVKLRIEKDGRVSRFEIVKPSGNVVVDESVQAVAQRVTRVDALPKGLGNGEFYEVKINFELNPEQ